MARIDGSYYKDQVKLAAKNYLEKVQQETTINIDGYQKYLESQKS